MIYNANEFVNYVKNNKLKFINYCEIIILKSGRIKILDKSHQETLIDLYCMNMRITEEKFKEIWDPKLSIIKFVTEKYGYISVWYNYIIRPEKINRFQERTLKILTDNNIIKIQNEEIATEYSWYLEHIDQFKNRL